MKFPRYPWAKWVPADNSNYRSANRTKISNIVIHVTDGRAKAMPVAKMWQEKNHGSSAHFVIDQDGTVLQCVELSDVAWHAHRANKLGVGIEHCARTQKELGPHDPGLPVSEAQYKSSSKLIAWLCKEANISIDRKTVQGHAEIDLLTSHKDCPTGPGFDLNRLVDMAKLLG